MSHDPRVSVVIPAYNSHATVAVCLAALRHQTRPADEIIVVNSSPETLTAAVVQGEFPEAVFVQSPSRLLPHAARNRGVELATGDVIVFTDPDCEPAPDWLAALLTGVASGHECVVGAMDVKHATWWQVGIHLCKFHPYLPGLASAPREHACTANACYTRGLWQRIGPFPDEIFCGDGVLSWRAATAGQAPYLLPEAVVKHHHDAGLMDLCRQRFQRGEEFGRVRIETNPGARRVWLSLLFSPTALPLVLARAARDAHRARWIPRYLGTLPVQALGHLMWELGEASAALKRRVPILHGGGSS
jgi:GT2 family glycosyltransferase